MHVTRVKESKKAKNNCTDLVHSGRRARARGSTCCRADDDVSERAGDHEFVQTKGSTAYIASEVLLTFVKCSCMELGDRAGYDAKRRRAAYALPTTANKSLTAGAADAHHIHRGVLTMKTVASVYSI